MFHKTERIPTFIMCPTCTRYSSRHFEYIISEPCNDPAKKFILNINTNLDHEGEKKTGSHLFSTYCVPGTFWWAQCWVMSGNPLREHKRERQQVITLTPGRERVQGHQQREWQSNTHTQVCLTLGVTLVTPNPNLCPLKPDHSGRCPASPLVRPLSHSLQPFF